LTNGSSSSQLSFQSLALNTFMSTCMISPPAGAHTTKRQGRQQQQRQHNVEKAPYLQIP
jgi:hypothetical protein